MPDTHSQPDWQCQGYCTSRRLLFEMTVLLSTPHSFGRSLTAILKWIIQLLLFKCHDSTEQSCGPAASLGHRLKFNSWIGNGILTNHWSISVACFFFFALLRVGFDSGCSLYLTNPYCYGWTVLQLMAGWDTNMPKSVGNWKMLNSDVEPLSMSPRQTDCSWPHVCSLLWVNTNKVYVTGKVIYLE